MADKHQEAEANLQKLAERLRQGWALQHPVSEETLAAVRQVVQQQWEQQQRQGQGTGSDKPSGKIAKQRRPPSEKKPSQEPPAPKPRKKSRGHSHDQDWGHSH